MAKPHEITESDGGGGTVTLEGTRDINLMRRAIVERWPVNPARMQAYMAALDRVIETSEDDRALVAAVSTLIAADRANVAAFLAALKESQGPREGDKHLHLNAPAEMFRELMNEVRTHQHPAEAAAEPAGDD